MTALALSPQTTDVLGKVLLPGADRDAEFLADKSRRVESVTAPENKEESTSAFGYIRAGMEFLWEHKGKIAIATVIAAGILTAYYFADYLPNLWKGFGFGDGGGFASSAANGVASGAPTESVTQAVQSAASSTNIASPIEAIRSTTDVLLKGDIKFDPTPIEVNGQRYSIETFMNNVSTWVKNPELGDSLRLIPGEHCRPSLEVPLQEALKERLIPHTVNGKFAEMFSGGTYFDPFHNLEQSRYFQNLTPVAK